MAPPATPRFSRVDRAQLSIVLFDTVFGGVRSSGSPQFLVSGPGGQIRLSPLQVGPSLQLNVVPQTLPLIRAVHSPSVVPPAAMLQAWQSDGPPSHGARQQAPSTQ